MAYWLATLVDDRGIRSTDDALRALRGPDAMQSAYELFRTSREHDEPLTPDMGVAIVAGSAMDLSGAMECGAASCLRRQIDTHFTRMWHYFDTIIAVGATEAAMFKMKGDQLAPVTPRSPLIQQIEVLLYLRSIGAESMVTFRHRPHYCVQHLPLVADNLGVSRIFSAKDAFVNRLKNSDEFIIGQPEHSNGRWRAHIRAPWGLYLTFSLPGSEGMERAEVGEAMASALFHEAADQFAGDLLQANKWHTPLATAQPLHAQWAGEDVKLSQQEANVALAFELPFLRGVDPKDLIRIRREAGDHFLAFRSALTKAIHQRVTSAEEGDPERIARNIVNEVINPELHNISRQLKTAQRALTKKTISRMALGAVTTTAGLMTGLPILAAAGMGMPFIASVLGPADSYLDERRDIEMSDMYFLWHAQQRARGDIGWL